MDKSTQKIWSVPQIVLASYLAGPIGGCYFLGKNYKEFGLLSHAKKTYLLGIGITLILVTLCFFIPEDLIKVVPKTLFPGATAGCFIVFAHTYQKKLIEKKKEEGSRRFSYWWCLLLGLSLLVIQFVLFFLYCVCLGFIFNYG